MTERDKEIGLHKAMLRAQGKSMETERQTVRCLINLNYQGMLIIPSSLAAVRKFMNVYLRLTSYVSAMRSLLLPWHHRREKRNTHKPIM